MAAIECPDCGKWVPDYADECFGCGYEFDDCNCSCCCDEEEDDGTMECPCCGKIVPDYSDVCYRCDYEFEACCSSYDACTTSSSEYGVTCGAKQCRCGKWVPYYAKKCWTCNSWF